MGVELLAGLEAVHDREVGVLKAGAPHLQIGERPARGVEHFAQVGRRVVGGMHVRGAVAAPAHLGRRAHRPTQGVGAAVGDDATAGQNDDAVGELLRLVQVVGGQQDRHVEVGDAADEVVKVAAGLRVEAGGRLVEKEHPWGADQADRHIEAAPLTAGQLQDLPVLLSGEADPREQVVDRPRAGTLRGGVRAVELAEVVQRLAHPPAGVIAPRLQDDAEVGPPGVLPADRLDAQHPHVPGRRRPEALEDLDRRRLTRAVGAEQRHDLTDPDGEVQAAQHVGGAVAHPKVARLDGGRIRRGRDVPSTTEHGRHVHKCSRSTTKRTNCVVLLGAGWARGRDWDRGGSAARPARRSDFSTYSRQSHFHA